MHIRFDTDCINFLTVNDKPTFYKDFDGLMADVINERKIDVMEYSINNKYLRAIKKCKGVHQKKEVEFEYHFLEKPAGVNKIYCVGSNLKKKMVKIDMPYTVMVVKLLYMNGVYLKLGDRLFHTNEPIKKDLSNFLWEWGLSNVYDGTYHICWGKEKLPAIDNQNSYQYIDEFFLGVNNNDLLRNKEINWAKMSTDVVHTLDIKKLKRLPYRLNSVIGINEF